MEYNVEEINSRFQEITEYDILKAIAARPGMYVGDSRLDYIEIFLNGFYLYKNLIRKDKMGLTINYEMEKWLFFRESVSIAHAATLNSWSLMRRCYGNTSKACEQFKIFIEELPRTGSRKADYDTVAMEIYHIYSDCRRDLETDKASYSRTGSRTAYMEIAGNSYESLFPYVNRMILEPYDDLWIYLHYEQYFLQVRFLYQTKTKIWVDNTALVNQKNYYQDLLFLHAYAAFLQKETDSNHIIVMHCREDEISVDSMEISDEWNEVFHHGADKNMLDKNPISQLFSDWKKNIV